ncbi:TPA: hypothetical protein N0F65_007246 [Lagenidium giganteum]|uniref:Amino acid transporter transmembrane domain-containing protein n=1 Tax=Lagenidium giganteum TaxID=4803 RepID=A0AAV2YKZ9_9STRA|nr:TPA: hypothetical protein N0F65_007246 [Lagenidium giganteum]
MVSKKRQQYSKSESATLHGDAVTLSPPHHIPNCGLSLTPVRHASKDIIETIKHQCECAPLSMGEYVESPRCLKAHKSHSFETEWLLQKEASNLAAFDVDVEDPTAAPVHADDHHATSTVLGSMFTLTNTILGSGTLAVPFAIASSGWLLGNAIMLAIAMITRYSVFLLLSASDRAGVNCAKTYESLGHYTMGKFGTMLAEFTFIFGGFGTLVSYFIFITDLFSIVFAVRAAKKWIVTVVCTAFVVLPLSLNRKIGKLRLASVMAILSITYVVIFVWIACVVAYNNKSSTVEFGKVEAVRFEPGSVYTVTLLIAAFACHNTALPVYDELRDRSISRMNKAVVGAIAIAFILYETIGLCGYLQFGRDTKDNILLNFSPEYVSANPSIKFPLLLGRTAMAVALLLTTPIAMWPFRSCILSVFLRIKNDGVQTPSSAATRREYTIVTIVSQTLILFCSIFVPSVKIPLSIVGSVSGSLLIFIMPSLFYLLQSPHPIVSRPNIGPLCMFGAGLCVGTLGLSLTLYKLVRDHF